MDMAKIGRQLLGTALVAGSLLVAGAAWAGVKEGVEAWQAGNYSAAVNEWRPLADKGDADAQFNLGQAYKLGRGVPSPDLRIAQTWYEKAAQQGHAQAQANLGLILFQNGERQRAMPWIRKAAEGGDPRAQYVLGTALFNGDLIGKDWPRAYALMSLAADAGLPQAGTNLQAMDQYVPVEQRRQGLALKAQLARAAGPAPSRTAVGPRTAPQPNSALASTLPALAPSRRAPIAVMAVPARVLNPAPAARSAPVAVASASGGWKVQLGAFSNGGNARNAWSALRAKAPGLAGLNPILVPAGAFTRLQAGPLGSRAAADKACSAAKAAGAACFPVAP
jgi:cell division septation protein DedD